MKKLLTALVMFLAAASWMYSNAQDRPNKHVKKKSHEKVSPWDAPTVMPVSKEKKKNTEKASNNEKSKPK